MAKSHRTLSLSRFRSKPHPRSTSGGILATVGLAGVTVVVGLLVIRSWIRHDERLQWRAALERPAASFAWPPSNADWPPAADVA